MPRIDERFSSAAANAARAAIADAGGNEVFLLGRTDAGRVTEVRVLARGNRGAVPALLKIPRPGEVVIHNHPSGVLVPSDADIEVASAFGDNGVGSYIVDNDVSGLYVIVEPHVDEQATPIDPRAVTGVLGPQGAIGFALSGYERRPQQLAMAEAVARAFNDDLVLTVEAGTGTGKSLAYLVPAILWARTNKERVVISTHTINLQEQLVKKDLPFLIEKAGLECSTALVKGRGNYLCKRKTEQVAEQGGLLVEDDVQRELAEIIEWSRKTTDGSLADLPVRPRPEVWEQVVSENDNCLRARCPFYSSCFFYGARRSAAAADILIVNHHLLMADLALRGEIDNYTQNAVLPPATRVVVDEAHHIEDVATEYFGNKVGFTPIERTLGRLQSSRNEARGVLPALRQLLATMLDGDDAMIGRSAASLIDERLLPKRTHLLRQAEECFARVLDAYDLCGLRPAAQGPDEKLRITADVRGSELWKIADEQLGNLAAALDAYVNDFKGLLERLAQLSERAGKQVLYLGTELRALVGRLAGYATAMMDFTEDDDLQCRWIELRLRGRGPAVSFHAAPVEVAPLLHKSMFDRFRTTVLTSATLAVGGRFEYLHQRIGIARLDPPERSQTLRVESPFDFARQSLLLVPDDVPDPGTPAYETAAHELIREAVRITRGGVFVLFTAYGALNRAHEQIADELRRDGLTPLRQGEMSRHLLLSRFKQTPGAVLFATDSFWEGVDVKGDALRCVIIARLPFKVPTEPIEQARVEAIEARGGNAFTEHAVPQAVIKLKQGFGRLIRSRQDSGCVLVLDSRIVRKRYGRAFVDSLPPSRRVIGPSRTVLEQMRQFYGRNAP